MSRRVVLVVAALALSGCSWAPVYTNDNGPNGAETLYLPTFGCQRPAPAQKPEPAKAPDPVSDPLEPTP